MTKEQRRRIRERMVVRWVLLMVQALALALACYGGLVLMLAAGA